MYYAGINQNKDYIKLYMQCMHVCTHAGRIARNQEKGMGIESLGYTEGDEKETRTRLERYDMVSYI